MKKVIPFLLIGILILSSIGAVNITGDENTQFYTKTTLNFPENHLLFVEDTYLEIELNGANSFTVEPTTPQLPIYIKTYELPKNVKIQNISCVHSNIIEQQISKKIIPVSKPIPLSLNNNIDINMLLEENKNIYEEEGMFPIKKYDYAIRYGLNTGGEPTTFVTVEVYPVRYEPTKNTVFLSRTIDIIVSYKESMIDTQIINQDSTNMVIIAPNEFSQVLQPLVEHKNQYGINTFIKTTEEIYNEYSGRDKPEQIKYYIKDAKETDNISYVLLVGGLKSMFFANDKDDRNQGSTDWYVPIRYTNIRGMNADKYGTPSDLYYADLYRYNEETAEVEFEDWDKNENDIFAEHVFTGRDELDLIPDVYLSRLACRNIEEVETVVNKIITYESSSPDEKPWFKTMVGVGGRTFYIEDGKPDGEIACDAAFNYMNDLIDNEVKVYASNNVSGGPIPMYDDITNALSNGAGYAIFEGHGSPMKWNTNWVEGSGDNWIGGITLHNFLDIKNAEKLPLVVIGGCHNALFNVSVIPALLAHYIDKDGERYWTSGYPTPESMSWRLVAKPDGGAIASTGCTGYGFGGNGAVSRSSELEINLFYMISQEGLLNLANAHSSSITKYVTENTLGKIEVHCIAVYQLFGDPSLRLGGYP